MHVPPKQFLQLLIAAALAAPVYAGSARVIDSNEEWSKVRKSLDGATIKDGKVTPAADKATFGSTVLKTKESSRLTSLTIHQSPEWLNWDPIENIGPENLADAPVLLAFGPDDYWMFGKYRPAKNAEFKAEPAKLDGFDIALMSTPFPGQYDAPGGLKKSLGGYHAWQSRDMKTWVHHGPVTEGFSRWVTSAEQVNGKVYIYYDFPNDQDPHLYIDEDLTDGKPGQNMGIAFEDPSDGSDSAIIRDLNGHFHVIYEDWSPINARKHSWDSPLGGRAVSEDGKGNFRIEDPVVDLRTKPTGEKGTYNHPHWVKEDPKRFKSNVATYEIHEPEQHAFGDWAAIAIGGQYYLFADYHPANDKIRVGWFTSSDITKPFTFCGELGRGHPDPDVIFAEGRFYLATQMKTDYVSSGPWVETVHARAGVDTDGDDKIDQWTDWQVVSEKYDYVPGFSKQVAKAPASLDLSKLPAGKGFSFEIRMEDGTENASKPVLDRVELKFDPAK